MRAISVDRALRLPLRVQGARFGQPVDALLDADDWRAIGFDVRCDDGSRRFLPFSTASITDEDIVVGSALLLLAEIDFYQARARSFRRLVGSPVEGGILRDLMVAAGGVVVELVVDTDGLERHRPAAGRRYAA